MKNLTFELQITNKSFVILLSPSRNNINVLTDFRKDIWKKSEVQNIIDTLNSVEIPIDSSDDYLKDEYSRAVDNELQRQCDVWNSKL